MAVLRKANFHLFDICRLMKSQSCKEEKNDSNITDLSCQVAHDVVNRKNVFLYGIKGCMLLTLEMLFHYL